MHQNRNSSMFPTAACTLSVLALVALGIAGAVSGFPLGLAVIVSITILILAGIAIVLLFRRLYVPLHSLYRFMDTLRAGSSENRQLEDILSPSDDPAVQELRHLLAEAQKQREHGHEVEMLHSRAEFDALQSQINPHFLYNTLESIRGQALVEGNREIATMTKKLSAIFRYSIGQSDTLVRLRDELDNVNSYMAIQQYRFEGKFDFAVLCDDLSEVQDLMLPKLTIQPLVENAIFHGLEPKIDAYRITITITRTQHRLFIEISDNGVGIPAAKLDTLNKRITGQNEAEDTPSQRHTGIALHNVNKRIRLTFGEDYGLSLYSTPHIGTEAHITLPAVSERPTS